MSAGTIEATRVRAASTKRAGASQQTRKARAFYGFVAPWAVGFTLLTVFPLGYAFWLSLTDAQAITPRWHFVGLANYAELFSDSTTLASLAKTGLFTVITVPLGIIAGLTLAVMVNRPIKMRGLFRTLLYLPAVVPPVGAALTFKLIFDRDAGAANGILGIFDANPVTWITDPYARYVMIMLTLWGVGGSMIISLAGLQDIPKELHEAARVDGASAWKAFRHVTLPLLSPVLFFQVVTGVIGSLQTFAPLLLAPNGTTSGVTAVPQSNYFYMINVLAQYFAYGRFGYASALLWVLFAVIMIVTGIIFKVSGRMVFYSAEPDGSTKK